MLSPTKYSPLKPELEPQAHTREITTEGGKQCVMFHHDEGLTDPTAGCQQRGGLVGVGDRQRVIDAT